MWATWRFGHVTPAPAPEARPLARGSTTVAHKSSACSALHFRVARFALVRATLKQGDESCCEDCLHRCNKDNIETDQ